MSLHYDLFSARKTFIRALALLFLFALTAQTAAAQEKKVILPSREMSVRSALAEVRKQTGYGIAVNWEQLDPDRKVFFAASSLTVQEVASQVLAGTDLVWEPMDGQFVIHRKPDDTKELPAYSAMFRTSLPQEMTVVRDKWAMREVAPEEITSIRNGYWSRTGKNTSMDSLGLAVLNFRVNRTDLERGYMDNAQTLDLIHRTFSDKELLTAMDFITVTAAASPEGNTESNARLAAERALAVKSYIMWKYPFMDRDRIFTFSIGEDWSGLCKMVYDDAGVPCREDVLEIVGSDIPGDMKRTRLRALDGGNAYRYIAVNMLPRLRGAAACMIYYKEEPQPVIIVDTVRTHSVDTVYVERIVRIEPTPEPAQQPQDGGKQRRIYYMAMKTNLLYDALLLPDLALEFSLPRRWSIEVGGQWSWWNTNDPRHYYHRVQFAGLEVRKWLGKRDRTPLTGHFLGLYGMAGNYDLKFGAHGQLCAGLSYSAGLTYGYAMPIRRRLNLEFSLGVGYLGGEYDKYTWDGQNRCYPWEATFERNYFGLTKAEVSLVWLIGSGRNPDKKR